MNIQKPNQHEYGVFYENYIQLVNTHPIEFSINQQSRLNDLIRALSEEKLNSSYAEGKWSIKELLVHCIDTERIMSYRLLCVLRSEPKELPGFDENIYAKNSNANARSIENILAEFNALRTSNIALMESINSDNELNAMGKANNYPISVRALLYIIPGHLEHHLNILISRYLN